MGDRVFTPGLPIVCTAPPVNGYNATENALLNAHNDWIRSLRNLGVIVMDLHRVYRDPEFPNRLRTSFTAGDGIHITDVGQAAAALEMQSILTKLVSGE